MLRTIFWEPYQISGIYDKKCIREEAESGRDH